VPSKNVIKTYVEDGYYHIYNRGVEKRTIFQDDQDYNTFSKYLKIYLEPQKDLGERRVKVNDKIYITIARPLKNYHNKIELLAYCLMPNHFHLLVKQKDKNTMEFFMRSLLTKYSVYFNKKNNRVGSLFQGSYKAVLIDNEDQLLHVSRYIHLNPTKVSPLQKAYSSYPDYLNLRKTPWLNTKIILSFFKNAQRNSLRDMLSYQSFVEDYEQNPKKSIGELAID